MIVHQHPGMHPHPASFGEFGQDRDETSPVGIVDDDPSPLVTSGHDVMPSTAELNAQGASHAPTSASLSPFV